MAASLDGAGELRANRALLPVLGLLAGGSALSVLYASTGVGVPCLFRTMTGWDCPLCGSTRLGAALLHGHLAEAFTWNPAVFLALGVLALLTTVWTVQGLTGAVAPRLRRLSVWLGRVSAQRWLLASVGLAVVYTVFRNLG